MKDRRFVLTVDPSNLANDFFLIKLRREHEPFHLTEALYDFLGISKLPASLPLKFGATNK